MEFYMFSEEVKELIVQKETNAKVLAEIIKEEAYFSEKNCFYTSMIAERNIVTDPLLSDLLIASKDICVREELAKNESLTQDMMVKLADDKDESVLLALSGNYIGNEAAEKLIALNNDRILLNLASSYDLCPEIYKKIYDKAVQTENKDALIDLCIFNKYIPVELIENLSNDIGILYENGMLNDKDIDYIDWEADGRMAEYTERSKSFRGTDDERRAIAFLALIESCNEITLSKEMQENTFDER